jgi:PAS domain S-box-containing protein
LNTGDLLEAIPAGVSLKNFDGVHVFTNSIYDSFFGLDKSQIIGKRLDEIPRERFVQNFGIADAFGLIRKARLFDDAAIVNNTKTSVFYEHEHIRVYKSIVRLENEPFLFTLVFDIRDRVEKEKDLRQSEERLRLVFELSHEAFVWVYELRGVVFNCNKKFSDLIGVEKSQLLHKKVFSFFREPLLAKRYLNEILTGVRKEALLMLFSSTGVDIPVVMRAVTVSFKDGNMIHLSLSDLTSIRKAEKEKEELQLRLMTAAKLSLIGEMSAGLAHEINNPLMVILGNLDLLEERISKCDKKDCMEEQLEYIGSIRTSGNIIEELVERMREHIKKFQPEGKNFHTISGILKESLDVLKFKNLRHKINIIDETDETRIFVSKTDIFQVFTNLISNAVDEVKGTMYRDIRIFNYTENNFIHVVFEDSGKGVSKADREKIFNPFFTTKRSEKGVGTGLGLSFCVNWLHRNSASIRYERLNEKTRFVCVFQKFHSLK